MQSLFRLRLVWFLSFSLLGLTSACQSLPVPPAVLGSAGASAETTDIRTYRSERLGLSFSYPQELTIEEKGNAIQVWAAEDYRAIREGKYAGGTELPPNLAIATYPNLQRLPLPKWLRDTGGEYFGALKEDVRETIISNRPVVAFSSDALYGQKNILLPSPKGDRIVAISMAELPVQSRNPEKHQTYQRAFELILATLSAEG